jgi:hypothetical protein
LNNVPWRAIGIRVALIFGIILFAVAMTWLSDWMWPAN